MKQTRFIITIMIAVMALLTLINACSLREPIALPSDIADRLITDIKFPRGLIISNENTKNDSVIASNILGAEFNPDIYESYAIYPSAENTSASEFGILKVKDKKYLESAKELAQGRIDAMRKAFDGYLDGQYEIAKGGEVRTEGRYVYYSMSEDNGKVFKIIKEMLDDK